MVSQPTPQPELSSDTLLWQQLLRAGEFIEVKLCRLMGKSDNQHNQTYQKYRLHPIKREQIWNVSSSDSGSPMNEGKISSLLMLIYANRSNTDIAIN